MATALIRFFLPTSKTPETESDGTPKMAKSSDITVVDAKETKTSKFDYNIINGTALNTSHYPCKVKVSLLLKKNGRIVYATWVNSPSDVLANGTFPRYDLCTQKYRLRLV